MKNEMKQLVFNVCVPKFPQENTSIRKSKKKVYTTKNSAHTCSFPESRKRGEKHLENSNCANTRYVCMTFYTLGKFSHTKKTPWNWISFCVHFPDDPISFAYSAWKTPHAITPLFQYISIAWQLCEESWTNFHYKWVSYLNDSVIRTIYLYYLSAESTPSQFISITWVTSVFFGSEVGFSV